LNCFVGGANESEEASLNRRNDEWHKALGGCPKIIRHREGDVGCSGADGCAGRRSLAAVAGRTDGHIGRKAVCGQQAKVGDEGHAGIGSERGQLQNAVAVHGRRRLGMGRGDCYEKGDQGQEGYQSRQMIAR
jgi:hypothetical protein